MNYSAMIQNRKSVRAFRGKEVPNEALAQLRLLRKDLPPPCSGDRHGADRAG